MNELKNANSRFTDTKDERVAIVNARHNETKDKLDSRISREMLSDQADATEVVMTGFGSLGNKILHGQS